MQTAGSAGESIAFGVGVTMPAIMILGFDLEITRVMLVAVLGGLLGILMMIPLRRALIVQQHGMLKYPEGTACAEVLKAGASEESMRGCIGQRQSSKMAKLGGAAPTSAKTIFTGFGIGFVYKADERRVQLAGRTRRRRSSARRSTAARSRPRSRRSCSASATSSARASPRSCAPAACSPTWCSSRRSSSSAPAWPRRSRPDDALPIRDMSPDDIRSAYILYIGAGAVAAGGIISLLRSLPTIWHGLQGRA